MGKLKTVNYPHELRIRLSENMGNDLYKLSEYTGMDITNTTRSALIEYIENHQRKLNLKKSRMCPICGEEVEI